jgi:hypothetical protein
MLNWFPGVAGAKVAAVINGEVDAYVHGAGSTSGTPRRPSRWRARPACTLPASTGRLAYNRADLLMPDILVCRPAVAGVLQAIREVTNAP